MKLQHLAIVFVIIIVPISMVLAAYINNHMDTITYQTQYNNHLVNATYDAIKAFQLNTQNNSYSTIGNSKIRDIEASINVFYDTLATCFSASGYNKDDLQYYIPAILITLYDGYYIYSSYYDTETPKLDTDGNVVKDASGNIETGDYTYGLKPFVYYSCRYKNGADDFVVNYTLDNSITIIGKINGEYITKTGYLVNLENFPEIKEQEILRENLIILGDGGEPVEKDTNGNPKEQSFQYIVYNNQKVYRNDYEGDYFTSNDYYSQRHRYFYYSSESRKDYVTSIETINYLNSCLDPDNNLLSSSAINYYKKAEEFTKWVNDNLKDIQQKHAVDTYGNKIENFATDVGEETYIFSTSNENDPLQSGSVFNEHRMSVIRKTIETNLISAIATFNRHTIVGYEFVMPKLSEDEWYKVENNVCMVSFMQGLPIGSKLYNNYCVVSNDTNLETVGNDSIYIIAKIAKDKETGYIEYHKPGCKTMINKLNSGNAEIINAYASSQFKRKTVSLTGADANAHTQLTPNADAGHYAYYYPQSYTSCYDCIVTASDAYSTDDIIAGKIGATATVDVPAELRNVYLRALARTRYDLYLTNGYFK